MADPYTGQAAAFLEKAFGLEPLDGQPEVVTLAAMIRAAVEAERGCLSQRVAELTGENERLNELLACFIPGPQTDAINKQIEISCASLRDVLRQVRHDLSEGMVAEAESLIELALSKPSDCEAPNDQA
jgi:hypothetical protein